MVGRHGGSFGFTVGQRRGLHLDRAAADGAPRYVLSLEPATNTVLVGPREQLEVTRIIAEHPVWTSGVSPNGPLACQVQLRAHGMVSDATVTVSGDRLVAALNRPQRGVAAGQALVMYRRRDGHRLGHDRVRGPGRRTSCGGLMGMNPLAAGSGNRHWIVARHGRRRGGAHRPRRAR